MSKAGSKIIEGAKQALEYVRCDHAWQRVSTSIRAKMITGQVDFCPKCGTRRTQTTKPTASR